MYLTLFYSFSYMVHDRKYPFLEILSTDFFTFCEYVLESGINRHFPGQTIQNKSDIVGEIMDEKKVSEKLEISMKILSELLPLGKSFDLMTRKVWPGGSEGIWVGMNGFSDAGLLEKVFAGLQNTDAGPALPETTLPEYLSHRISFVEMTFESDFGTLLTKLLSGNSLLFVDGFSQAVVLDTRTYPARGVQEPELEQMTRGARDGFIETLLTNTCLIRRRIRNPQLVFEMHTIGKTSRTDVAIAYLQDRCDPELVKKISHSLDALQVTSLTMGSKSLEELLVKRHWWNPLPSMQMTERPDVAASYLMEGHVILLVDNTPMALILPCTIFQFTQSAEDYYKNPVVGTYLRLIRFLCIPVALLLMPLFLLFTAWYPELSQKWQLITTEYPDRGHLIFYVLFAEFLLALFQYSASLTSEKFSGSLSIVGGLLIGDMAVNLNWSSSEVLFYGAITLLATLSASSVELSDALRIYRMFLILCTAFGGPAGFWTGLVLTLLSILTTPTFGGYSYFWPLFPFNGKALKYLLLRTPTASAQPSRIWKRNH